ncbi:tRNA 2-thiouridine(34) synthase MnmA [Capillibacterium thermochitinicola]|uniref:tRNA-specific 2-thiouridylase MnmA n=1 Tax=Capillibacterium thermochitinicola TaxID=2699427 RepID=A0A8J6LI54_9FIRM|nr:tRNA 2-thiouridine(34) synthase MnmA [Capillibacterium thermochitinicola]MBA2132286.1 tRNA 2-thiouridine(34) synthase MnmA [Capillibacterium thermochitinicola]
MTKLKVVVGMSGGVDSSVTAHLLQEAGYEVIGVTMQIWPEDAPQEESGGCCGLTAVDDARRVCQQLGIPHYTLNFRQEFQKHVIDYFIREYQQGRTPNPCIACNRFVKWESLLTKALQLGADYIATGHYARIVYDQKTRRYLLKKAATSKKDQTYALYNLTQKQMARTLMPLGDYTKEEVRQIAAALGLRVAKKPDSQEICFIPDHDYGRFIEEHAPSTSGPGHFVDRQGRILGQHKGIIHYTVGQRKGLGLAVGKPLYVLEIRPETNEVVVGTAEEVYQQTVYANQLNFIPFDRLTAKQAVTAKIRYNHDAAPATVMMVDDTTLRCDFATPQRAITPGQALVLYDGELVIGGGVIVKGE